MWFKIPESYPLTASQFKTDKEGNRYISFASIRWFTNLESSKKRPFLPLTKSYSSENYRKFVNYDKAINVDKLVDIPAEYTGEMGVPLTFLDKHNPEQFEIIAIPIAGCIEYTGYKPRYILYGRDKGKLPIIGGAFYVPFNPELDKHPFYQDCETGDLYTTTYCRIIIKIKS